MILRARQFEFLFPRPALVMGILNVTPDSFSDGGLYLDPEAAVDRAYELMEQGSDIVDVGGESTRPKAQPVSEAEELKRVLPVLERLAGRLSIPISIDTTKEAVARAALETGAAIINDIAANRNDPGLWELAAQTGAGYILMHMKGTPATMQEAPVYQDVRSEVDRFFEQQLQGCLAAGIHSDQIVLDVGIGFGKTMEHNLELLAGLSRFTRFKRPLLLGVSRKSFLGRLLKSETGDRLAGGLACACWGVSAGVQIIRTHDVAETRHALRMTEAIRARLKP